MITLVIVKNPFEPWNGREQKQIESGITAKELIEQCHVPGVEMLVVVNGTEVDENYVTKDGDFVVVSAVVGKSGKNIFALILSIGLSIFAGAIIGANALAGWGSGFMSGTFGAYMVATAVMFLGNFLVGRMMGQDVDTGSYGQENPTYSWAGVQTMQGQNNAIAMTYGTVVSGGQTIGKYVTTVDNEEYLNWLVACGEGELTISDIKINENDVSYFQGVVVETRSGTNTQDVISNFNDTFFTKPLEYVIGDTARIDTAQGNATEGLIAKVEFRKGLYYANDSGGLSQAWVRLLGYYRQGTEGEWIPFVYAKQASEPGYATYIKSTSKDAPTGSYNLYAWITTVYDEYHETIVEQYASARITYPDSTQVTKQRVPYNTAFTLGHFSVSVPPYYDEETENYPINENFTVSMVGDLITGSQTSVLRKEYRVDNLAPAEYYVKLEITARSNATTDSRAGIECTWSALTSIVYDDFMYPNIALIGIKALATDQLNGNPTLKFTKTRSKILAWNPHTEQYEEKNANNPAWASYDALHLCRRLEDPNNLGTYEYDVGGVSADRMLYDMFSEWADFCTEKEYYVNIEINQLGEMLDVINQKIAPIGHGRVLRFGTRYGATWDCAKQPVQMFGMGNIKAGTFKEEFLPTNDRANCVELTYMDAESGWNRETITIMADDYDTAAEVKTAQATFDGITSYEQAYREGKYQLFCNRYRIRTVTFEADIDSISCTIGDVVLVAHDVPKWGKSGRIYAVDGDVLTLPVELGDTTSDYRVLYRTVNDNMYTSNCEILENADGWCKVKIASFNAEDPPQPYDVFDIAVREIGTKPFIIQNISRAKDFARKIDCIEYDERIYSEDYSIPPIDYTEVDLRPKNVTNLVARAFHYLTGMHVDVSWQQASNGTFTLYFFDGTNWNLIVSDLRTNQYSADVDYEVTQVRVVTTLGVMSTSGVIADVQNIDSIVSALTINNLKAKVMMNGNTGVVSVSWDSVLASDLKNYVVVFRGSNYNTLNPNAEFGGVPQGTYTVSVKAKTYSGNYGNTASVTVSAGAITDNTVAYSKTVPTLKTSAKIQSLGGNTVAWNQLVNAGTTTVATVSGRKYYTLINGTASVITSDGTAISVADDSADMVTDLTRCFGEGNEPSASEFTAIFPNAHYSYNAGQLLSASVDEIVSKENNTVVDTYSVPASVQAIEGYGWSAGSVYNEVDYVNKKFFKRVGRVILDGTQTISVTNWGKNSSSVGWIYPYALTNNKTSASATTKGNVIASHGVTLAWNSVYSATVDSVGVRTNTDYGICVRVTDPTLTTESAINAYLSAHPITVYYELATPVETDISAYLDDGMVETVGGGTITFENSNGDGYKLPVPSTEVFN